MGTSKQRKIFGSENRNRSSLIINDDLFNLMFIFALFDLKTSWHPPFKTFTLVSEPELKFFVLEVSRPFLRHLCGICLFKKIVS
jgi:hypothetical protein